MTPVEFARSSCTDHYYYRFSRSQFTKASKSEVSVDASTEAWEEEEAIDDEDEVEEVDDQKWQRSITVGQIGVDAWNRGTDPKSEKTKEYPPGYWSIERAEKLVAKAIDEEDMPPRLPTIEERLQSGTLYDRGWVVHVCISKR